MVVTCLFFSSYGDGGLRHGRSGKKNLHTILWCHGGIPYPCDGHPLKSSGYGYDLYPAENLWNPSSGGAELASAGLIVGFVTVVTRGVVFAITLALLRITFSTWSYGWHQLVDTKVGMALITQIKRCLGLPNDDNGVNSEIKSTCNEDENKNVCSISENKMKEVVKEAMGDERFIAVKGNWKGMSEDVFLDKMDGAWCIFGDFNVIRMVADRLNPQVMIKEMVDFNDFINLSRLVEVPMGGRKFTRLSDDRERDSLWVRVIKSIYGENEGLSRCGEEGCESSGMGDIWIMDSRLCDGFPRLFHLDRRQEGRAAEKGRDIWQWKLNEEGGLVVKELTKDSGGENFRRRECGRRHGVAQTCSKKINIFVWRALKRRLSICEELDKRGAGFDTVLCQCCNSVVESCEHSLVIWSMAMGVWEKVHCWWKLGGDKSFSIRDMFSLNGGANPPFHSRLLWQVVLWCSGYFIWKKRNNRLFKGLKRKLARSWEKTEFVVACAFGLLLLFGEVLFGSEIITNDDGGLWVDLAWIQGSSDEGKSLVKA
nr:RNA-directed DNA polymerase, eukaryota, reverse transcriptase zinc-binding domain protein [Tanacetum cinerariifolium]